MTRARRALRPGSVPLLTTAPRNAPHVNTCPLTANAPPSSPPPPNTPISGSTNESVNWLTSAVKAVPMTTATARSTMPPRGPGTPPSTSGP